MVLGNSVVVFKRVMSLSWLKSEPDCSKRKNGEVRKWKLQNYVWDRREKVITEAGKVHGTYRLIFSFLTRTCFEQKLRFCDFCLTICNMKMMLFRKRNSLESSLGSCAALLVWMHGRKSRRCWRTMLTCYGLLLPCDATWQTGSMGVLYWAARGATSLSREQMVKE